MHKLIAIAALLAALSFTAPQVAAGETSTESKMQPTAGAASDQAPGSETSDRTPEKATPTPDAQVDKTKEGETSDRTPETK